MKIAVAQINPIIGDFKYNTEKIRGYAEKARALSCDLVVFPELAITGYPPRDLLEKENFVQANIDNLNKLIETIRGIGVICGFVDRNTSGEGNPLHNAAVLFENGEILFQVQKRLLPTYDVFDEGRYFEPGSECKKFAYKGHRIGLTICEDAWNDKDVFEKRTYHIDPLELIIADGADLIINISASPFFLGKREFRWHMLGSIAEKYRVPLIFANQVGGNDSVLFDGVSAAFDRNGKIIAGARDFEEDLISVDLDAETGDRHAVSGSDPEAVLKALVLGTRDYVTKCGFSKAVVGLSGGIDSALTAWIAVKALGNKNVLAVFMPSKYTSPDNFEDTRELAQNLGIELVQVPIDDVFHEFLKLLSPEGRADSPDVTEQNIQARIRGTILMAFSNRQGALLLSTGNKSELAVGYCTLYGDMNGGLAVISDVPKTVVYQLADFINREGEAIPLRILRKAPSAELKPDQKDQDDLPPYETLDPVLKAYVEDRKGPEDLIQMGFEKDLIKDVIGRVDQNEYKRHQAAPGLKVTSKAFGYGRRYPIAQRFSKNLIEDL